MAAGGGCCCCIILLVVIGVVVSRRNKDDDYANNSFLSTHNIPPPGNTLPQTEIYTGGGSIDGSLNGMPAGLSNPYVSFSANSASTEAYGDVPADDFFSAREGPPVNDWGSSTSSRPPPPSSHGDTYRSLPSQAASDAEQCMIDRVVFGRRLLFYD